MKKSKAEIKKSLKQLNKQDRQIYNNIISKHKSKMIKAIRKVV